jgi:hypothetical protein
VIVPHHPRRRGSLCKWRPPATGTPHPEHAGGMVTVGQQQVRCAVQRERPPRGATHRAPPMAARLHCGRSGPGRGLARHCCIKAEDVLTMHQNSDADLQEPRRTSQIGHSKACYVASGRAVHQARVTERSMQQCPGRPTRSSPPHPKPSHQRLDIHKGISALPGTYCSVVHITRCLDRQAR